MPASTTAVFNPLTPVKAEAVARVAKYERPVMPTLPLDHHASIPIGRFDW